MLYCGASVKMNYMPKESGALATSIAPALKKYFGYDENTHYVLRSDFGIDEWEDLIYTELAAGRPVIYDGRTLEVGHEFVCDGYQNGLFHFNWGWDGNYDGYFSLSVLNPNGSGVGGSSMTDGYSIDQGAVIGIQKPSGVTSNGICLMALTSYSLDDNNIGMVLTNTNADTFAGEVGLAFFEEGKMQKMFQTTGLGGLEAGYAATFWFNTEELTALKDGNYRLQAVYRTEGENDWTLCEGASMHYIEVNVSNEKTAFTIHPVASLTVVSLTFSEGKTAVLQDIVTTISNKSSDEYNGYLVLYADGLPTSATGAFVKAGEAADIVFRCSLPSGSHSLLIKTDTGETLYEEDVTISNMGTKSGIILLGEELLCGYTYTHSDFSDIQSGSIMVSEDGQTLTFDNLQMENNMTEEDNNGSGVLFDVSGQPLTIKVKGTNHITTTGYVVLKLERSFFTITGDGSLTTKSNWFDFQIGNNTDFIIDNTNLICEGPIAIGDNMNPWDYICVKHSHFNGKQLFRIASLTLINSAFATPTGAFFDSHYDDEKGAFHRSNGRIVYEDGNVKGADGYLVEEFSIQPVEGDFSNVVRLWDFGTVIVEKGTVQTLHLYMKNEGTEAVENISYVITTDGNEQPEQTVFLDKQCSQTGRSFSVPVYFTASDAVGSQDVILTVTKVNGRYNLSAQKTAKGVLGTVEKCVPHRMVIEFFADAGCSWSPRGDVGLKLLKDTFNENIITIASHTQVNDTWMNYPIGSNVIPSARLNRSELVDPYYGYHLFTEEEYEGNCKNFGIKEEVEREMENNTLADVSLTAEWANEDKTAIYIHVTTTFLIDADARRFTLNPILIEDGMTGWMQLNSYSGNPIAPDFQEYVQHPYEYTDMIYNNVAIASWYEKRNGIRNSIKSNTPNVP